MYERQLSRLHCRMVRLVFARIILYLHRFSELMLFLRVVRADMRSLMAVLHSSVNHDFFLLLPGKDFGIVWLAISTSTSVNDSILFEGPDNLLQVSSVWHKSLKAFQSALCSFHCGWLPCGRFRL